PGVRDVEVCGIGAPVKTWRLDLEQLRARGIDPLEGAAHPTLDVAAMEIAPRPSRCLAMSNGTVVLVTAHHQRGTRPSLPEGVEVARGTRAHLRLADDAVLPSLARLDAFSLLRVQLAPTE